MSNAAVVIELFPTETAETLAASYLKAKREAEAAEERMKALEERLKAAIKASGRKGVSVAGTGQVSLVEGGSMRLDQKAATAALIAAGIEVPMKPAGGGEYLRASLD